LIANLFNFLIHPWMEGILAAVAKTWAGGPVKDPMPAVAVAVRTCSTLPLVDTAAHEANRFQVERLYPQFAPRVAGQQRRVVGLLSKIVELVEPGAAQAVIDGICSSDPDFSDLSEFLDRLRESAETCIDEARGQHSSQQVEAVQNRLTAAAEAAGRGGNSSLGSSVPKRPPAAKAMDKPQLAFADTVDNRRDAPVVPRLPEPCFRAHNAPPPTPGVHPYANELSGIAFVSQQVWSASVAILFLCL
jgi:hypothetical protein